MTRPQSIQRLWTTKIRPHSSSRIHLYTDARCRMTLPLDRSRRGNQYQAYPTRLRSQDQAAIKEYLAKSDDHPAVAKFISSVVFVREITGYTFVDGHLLLQALYGVGGSENPQQRLAILGDILLQYILKDDWFHTGQAASRIGEIASAVVTNANLANVAKEIGLVKHIGVLDPRTKERTGEHQLGTIMEALLGAIHEDSGKDIGTVRRAMHQMGLTLPKWYTANLRSYQKYLEKYSSEPNQPDLQKTKSELDQSDLHKVKYNQDPQLDSPDLQEATSKSSHAVDRKMHSSKRLNMRNIRKNGGLEAIHMRRKKAGQGPFESEDSDQRRLGYEYRISEKQSTSDEDFEALDATRARLDDIGANEENSLDYDAEPAVPEDADSKQTHPGDQDADQMGLETSATHQESIEPTPAQFTSSSWRQLVLENTGSLMESKTAKQKQRDKSPPTDFYNAIGAFMIKSDDSLMSRGVSEWPVRHSWFPQRCQITLDVALSKKPETTKEVRNYELNQLMAASTLDVITLPKLPPPTKELAAYDTDRLRMIVAPPLEIEGLIAKW